MGLTSGQPTPKLFQVSNYYFFHFLPTHGEFFFLCWNLFFLCWNLFFNVFPRIMKDSCKALQACKHIYRHKYVLTCMHVCMYLCKHVCMYVCMCVTLTFLIHTYIHACKLYNCMFIWLSESKSIYISRSFFV